MAIHSSHQTRYTRFPQEYFSGAQVSVYFGKIWVDEIVSLQFSLIEKVMPIFGYKSYVADTFVRGNRLVQGQFTINFKESYYLKNVLDRLEKDATLRVADNPEIAYSNDPTVPNVQAAITELQNLSNVMQESGIDMSKSSIEENYRALAEAYQRALWGDPKSPYDINNKHNTYFFPKAEGKSALQDKGFNIVITYGNTDSPTGTVKNIVGVQLASCSQILNPSGNPVLEEYSFIAKDLDGPINQ